MICTPISLTAQRNGGTRQRNAFQPLQFAPARRGKVHYFRNTALRYSSAVRLPLLFPKKSFGFFGDPYFPFIRGLKRSTGRTVIPIPDRHRSGRRRFSFSIAARLFSAEFNGMGLQSLRHLRCHLPLHKGGLPSGIPVNPSSVSLRLTPSPLGRLIATAVCGETPHPALRATFPSRGRLFTIAP